MATPEQIISNEIAKQIVNAVTSEIEKLEKRIESKLKTTKFSGTQIKQNTLPGNVVKDGSLPSGKFYELSAFVIDVFNLSAQVIISELIQSHQIDTEILSVMSSDQLRILANGEGIFAFFQPEGGSVDPTSFVHFSEQGIIGKKNDVTLFSLSWDGFRMFETVGGVAEESLVLDSTGKLYLKRGLLVGTDPADGILIDGTNKSIGTSRYASGELGTGWRVESDGSAFFNNLRARGVFTSAVHQFNKISSAGGSFLVTPTLILGANSAISTVEVSTKTHYSITIEFPFTGSVHHANGMNWNENDLITLQGIAEVSNEPYEVVDLRFKIKEFTETGCILESIPSIDECTFYKQSNGEAYDQGTINLNGGTLLKSASMMFVGRVAEDGSILHKGIYLSVTDEYGPYIDVYDSESASSMPKVRIGNLDGITNTALRVQPFGYGGYFENVHVIGQAVLNKGIIGGMNLDEHTLSTSDGMTGIGDGSAESPAGNCVIWAGNVNPEDALFKVYKDGTLNLGSDAGAHVSYDGETLNIVADSMSIKSGETTIALGGAIEGLLASTSTLEDFKEEQESYIFFDGTGVNVTAPDFLSRTIVSSDGLHIKDNTGVESAHFTDGNAYIQNAEITKQLKMASLVGEPRADGRITWRKI